MTDEEILQTLIRVSEQQARAILALINRVEDLQEKVEALMAFESSTTIHPRH